MTNADVLWQEVDRADLRNTDVVIDVAQLRFLDSAGVHALVSVGAALDHHASRLVLRDPPDNVQRLLEILGLWDLIPHVRTDDPEPPDP